MGTCFFDYWQGLERVFIHHLNFNERGERYGINAMGQIMWGTPFLSGSRSSIDTPRVILAQVYTLGR